MTATQDNDVQQLERLAAAVRSLRGQVAQRIVGQDEVVSGVLTALLAGGHSLLIGVPGLAKTLLVSTIAEALHLSFNRVQFTPDLMPGDITGTELVEEDPATGKRGFRFVPGPVFANVLLADEINRTPPKTQAALLQAMQEHQVTAAGKTYQLPDPFFVLATQNPIEQEGTYPLPEAQLDRFMLELRVGYPSRDEEEQVVERTTGEVSVTMRPVLTAAEIARHAEAGAADPGLEGAGPVGGLAGADDPTGRWRCPGVHSGVRGMGRGAAGLAIPRVRRQGAGGDGRPADGRPGRRESGGAVGAPAPDRHQLQRRSGGAEQRKPGERAGCDRRLERRALG